MGRRGVTETDRTGPRSEAEGGWARGGVYTGQRDIKRPVWVLALSLDWERLSHGDACMLLGGDGGCWSKR